jgi:transposase
MVAAVIPRLSRTNLGFAMWTPTTRQQHSRIVTRYQTDLTDAEWRVIAPHLPKPCTTGRPREWPMREIVLASSMLRAAARGACANDRRMGDDRIAVRDEGALRKPGSDSVRRRARRATRASIVFTSLKPSWWPRPGRRICKACSGPARIVLKPAAGVWPVV